MSGLFKSKKSKPAQSRYETVYDPFPDLRKGTSEFIQGRMKTPVKYEGERVAPLSEQEQASLVELKKYQDSPYTTDTFTLGRDEVRKTLAAGRDPTNDPTYQAVKAAAERENQLGREAVDRQFATMPGRFYGGARQKALTNLETDTRIGLNKTLADVQERQEGRRERLLPIAKEYDIYETEAPARKAEVLQQLGQLPRAIQQAIMDALYEQFINEQEQQFNAAQLGTSLSAQQPILAQTGFTQPSIIRLLMGALK